MLTSLSLVGHAEKEAPAQSQWHLFNDFLVRPIPREEALSFAEPWKTPAVLVFQAKSANNKIDLDWRQHLDTGLLFHDFKPDEHDKTYRPLNPETEMPGRDTLIALDTEFVSVRPPELEINSDGARSTVRPIAYALARASVVRGDGEDAGVAFIDDYVEIKEPIDDYLTSYSGIRPSDLNPQTTTRSLLPLKIVFKRLWLLSNLGCRFVGHGLKQDFRVINIYIPKSQIIDTIDLFFLKSRYRKLSLAFLAWVILKEEIQTETHDSIEDSRTALALYRKYLEYVDAGILESRLHEIYQMGERYKFKPPKRDGASDSLAAASRTDTPPVPGGDVPGAGGASAGAPAVAGPSTPSRRGLAGGSGGGAMGGGGSPAWTPGTRSPFR